MNCKILCCSILAIAIGMITPASETAAAIDAALDGKTKINLTERHLHMLDEASSLFQRTLDGLSKGDEKQGMLPEKNPEVLSNLGEVSSLWADYRPVNESIIASGQISGEQLITIARVNLPVLKQMHKTVGVIEKVYGSSGKVHPALALALNISGRQRMLSQKASKEFCLVTAGIDVAANGAALKDTVDLFTRSLEGLIHGDPETALAPAPTPEIQAQLEKVQAMWEPLRKVLLEAGNGNVPSHADTEKVATDNDPLLKEMNKAVFMYNDL